MKLKTSIIAIAALSSMSFAGGDIGGVTTFETGDVVAAEVEAVEPAPQVVQPEPQKVVAEPKKEEPKVEKKEASTGGPYIGLGATAMGVRLDDRVNLFSEKETQDRQAGITAVLGYDFMDYLGAELRYALSVSEENGNNDNLESYGVYLKPKYPIGDLNLYGLLGFAQTNMSDPLKYTGDNSGFSYGGGLDYGVTENISVFTDIVNYLRDEDGSNSTWGASLGVKYNF